jgi:hypothetical protein
MFVAALFIIAKLWNQPRCPKIGECIKTLVYIYSTEHYPDIKNEIMSFAGKWMEQEDIMSS